jgi:hypothetical protein
LTRYDTEISNQGKGIKYTENGKCLGSSEEKEKTRENGGYTGAMVVQPVQVGPVLSWEVGGVMVGLLKEKVLTLTFNTPEVKIAINGWGTIKCTSSSGSGAILGGGAGIPGEIKITTMTFGGCARNAMGSSTEFSKCNVTNVATGATMTNPIEGQLAFGPERYFMVPFRNGEKLKISFGSEPGMTCTIAGTQTVSGGWTNRFVNTMGAAAGELVSQYASNPIQTLNITGTPSVTFESNYTATSTGASAVRVRILLPA